MSEKIKQNLPLLLLLEKSSPKLRGQLLKDLASSQDFCKLVEEIFFNMIKGNIKLSKEAERKVRKERKLCLLLSTLRKSVKSKLQRERALKQSGGFLPFLLPAIFELLN